MLRFAQAPALASQKLRNLSWGTLFPWLFILVGTFIRLERYLVNRSLWTDEASVALDIVHTSISGFLRPQALDQAAPFGFLVFEKLSIGILGNNEYALRLLPLASGIAALFVLYKLAALYVSPLAATIAVGLLAISAGEGLSVVYYSNEVKPYSSDVVVALLILIVAAHVHLYPQYRRNFVLLALVGTLAIWCSLPSIFVLASIGAALMFHCIKERNWSRFRVLLVIGIGWLLSFALYYLVNLRFTTENAYLQQFWSNFMPPPGGLHPSWFYARFLWLFLSPGGLVEEYVAIVFLIGTISLLFKKPVFLMILILPLLFALIAAILHKYPFGQRLMLFAAPILFILIGTGIDQIWQWVRRVNVPVALIVTAAVIGSIFVPTLAALIEMPFTRVEIKQIMAYVEANRKPDDVIYIFSTAQRTVEYYADRYDFTNQKCIIQGTWDRNEFLRDLDNLRGDKRVWLIISDALQMPGVEQTWVNHLDNMGHQLDSVHAPDDAAAYLYDLSS